MSVVGAQGTNGGVTPLGLAASLAGGVFIGSVFYAAGLLTTAMRGSDVLYGIALRQWRLVPLGVLPALMHHGLLSELLEARACLCTE